MWYDVTFKLRVRLGEATIDHLQQHYSMVKVLAAAFGGGKKSDGAVVVNDMKPKQAVAALNDFFRV